MTELSLEQLTEKSSNAPEMPASDLMKITFSMDGRLNHFGGVSNYILTLGDYFSSQGHDVNYLVADSMIEDHRVRKIARTIMVPTNGSWSAESLPAKKQTVRETIEELKPDVLHAQLPFNPFVSGRSHQFIKPEAAFIGTFHSLPNTFAARYANLGIAALIKNRLKKFDYFFSASRALTNHSKHVYEAESALLPLPINMAELNKGERLPEYDDDKLNLLYFGRLETRKGCQHLLRSLSLTNKNIRNNIRLIIAGNGPLKKNLEQFTLDKNLQKTVEFRGSVAPVEKSDMLASSDIAIFPATSGESFGLVLAEAMSATTGIVVGGNNPGYSEVLKEDKDALFDPLSYTQTAEFLVKIIRDDYFRDRIRERQQKIVKNYDISVIGPRIMEIYKKYYG